MVSKMASRSTLVLTIVVAALATSRTVAIAAEPVESVTLQMGWIAGGDRAQYYLAKQAGFFAAENLDVRILSGKGASDSQIKLASGAAEFGESSLDSVLDARAESNVPVKAVFPMFTKVPDGLLTTTASGIKGLKDLEGKTVATSPFTSSNGPWPFLLKLNGVDPEKVKLVKAAPTALVPMLASGQVDAIIQFVNSAPLATPVLNEAGKTLVVVPWAQYGLEGYSQSVLTSEKMLATKRDVVARFLRALKKAMILMRDDPAGAAAALKANVPEIDLAVAEAQIRASLPLIFNEVTDKTGFGVFSKPLVEKTWEWVAREHDMAPDKIDPMTAVDTSFAN